MVDLYRSYQEYYWGDVWDERLNQQSNSKWTANNSTTKRAKVLLTFPYKLGESEELRSSRVLALIPNIRESIVLDKEEWCFNGVFNFKMSKSRTSLQLLFAKYDSLFVLNLYLEVRRQPPN
jgi:hypothetical protein